MTKKAFIGARVHSSLKKEILACAKAENRNLTNMTEVFFREGVKHRISKLKRKATLSKLATA